MAKTKGAVKKAAARAPAKAARAPARRGKTRAPAKTTRPPARRGKAGVAKAVTATKLPTVALKPKHPTRPSIALPPPPPPPPPDRDELLAPRDIGRLLRYGERFGPHKIDVRMLPLQLPVNTGALAAFDPIAPKRLHVFDRPVGTGQFRVMLSVARTEDKQATERLAAVVIHVGRPPIAKWTVAHLRGHKKPKSADQLPRVEVTSGWIVVLDAGDGVPGVIAMPETSGIAPIEIPLPDGRRALALRCGNGAYAAYWAVDATDKPVCLVLDFDVFTQKEWRSKPT